VERLQESVVVDAPPFSIDLCTKDRLFTLSVDTEQEMLLWALALLTAAPRLAPPVAGAAAKAATLPKAEVTPLAPGAVEAAAAGAVAKAAALSVPEPPVPPAAKAEAEVAALAVDPAMAALEAEMAAALASDAAEPAAPSGASSAAAAAIEVVHETVAQDIDSLALLVAARLKGKVDSLWAAMPTDANGSIERLACWAVLLADAELADLVGSGDVAKGKQ
jgi:hypothetical protein